MYIEGTLLLGDSFANRNNIKYRDDKGNILTDKVVYLQCHNSVINIKDGQTDHMDHMPYLYSRG